MSIPTELSRLTVHELAERFQGEMIPLNSRFVWFSAVPLGEDDVKEYLGEPVAALPAAIQAVVPKALVFLVPFLEKPGPKAEEIVTFQRPDASSEVGAAHFTAGGNPVLVFGIRERDVADYHHSFYGTIATLVADRVSADSTDRFIRLLREELRGAVHGEVDEESWNLKLQLIRKQNDPRRDSKLFRAYARRALIDTLTMYLHGICCDIDVDTGPRQLPSRHIRKRLDLLRELFPPPDGYAVFPEELST